MQKPYMLLCVVGVGALAVLSGCGGGGGSSSSPPSASGTKGPVIESFSPASDTNAVAGEQVMFLVNAQEESKLNFRWSIDGVQENAAGRELLVQTQAGDTTVHTISVEVKHLEDNVSTTIHWRLHLFAQETNQPPVIVGAMPSGPISVTQGEAILFHLIAADPDAHDQLNYHWFLNGFEQAETSSSFRLLSAGLPLGTHLLEGAISDGHPRGVGVMHSWSITVTLTRFTNHAPVIQAVSPRASVHIVAGSSLNLRVTATDPDGNELTYSWFVDGASQSATAAAFRYTTDETNVGTHFIRVRVDDGLSNTNPADPTFTWNVTVERGPPRPPPGDNPCNEKSILAVGNASGNPGELVQVEVRGRSVCEVSGFSLAIGHDQSQVEFLSAEPGQFLRDYAGNTLYFSAANQNAQGFMSLLAIFDLFPPITVPPRSIPGPPDTVLATLTYRILPNALPGTVVVLRNADRTFGSPPISNSYSGPPGQPAIRPVLVNGAISVSR